MTCFVEIFQLIRKLKWGEVQELRRHADAKTSRHYNQDKDSKADSHIARRAHAVPMPFPCHAVR
jgi:hypothetical protein